MTVLVAMTLLSVVVITLTLLIVLAVLTMGTVVVTYSGQYARNR